MLNVHQNSNLKIFLDNLNPSALIPFCMFDGDMTLLGTHRDNFSLPVCTAFKPRVLDSQTCYYVDLADVAKDREVQQGEDHGLVLFIDSNNERMVDVGDQEEEDTIEFEANIHAAEAKNDIKIYINTLEPYTGYGSGHYELSSVKVMATTPDFLSLPESVSGCQARYSATQCREEQDRVKTETCGCVPFSLAGVLGNHSVSR